VQEVSLFKTLNFVDKYSNHQFQKLIKPIMSKSQSSTGVTPGFKSENKNNEAISISEFSQCISFGSTINPNRYIPLK